ncbi:GNAT family N-acetyltransferase [Jidongwangia harbinensis]|uniref:GNAT family N-acetyltransferase n=1 Tax=Jidongwangia harbinensis TaxID=2878561 RepID=UPI001CDA52A6|nr:GNAT family N-acetyltransferase [Jidongwangia harbinensis]MCA2213942.1 GNAT family N-acetyltransferase [Jidongwangia harbinensis]
MQQHPVDDARALIAQRFPEAVWAVVTGSVLTDRRTPGSDLDIVVQLPDGDPAAPHRASLHFRGWPVELFVHDRDTLAHYLARELPGRRPTLHRMVATGVPVAGDPGEITARCAAVLAAGPGPLPDAATRAERYALTDTLDDLVHATDPGERTAIAGAAWVTAGEAALRLGGHWVGRSKWLLRELHDLDPALAAEWLAAAGDPDRIAALLRRLLDQAGGALFAGYRVPGERPADAAVRVTAVRDGDRLGWLASAGDGRPLGSAFLRPPGEPGGTGGLELAVHPAERRRGIGTRLLDAVDTAARERRMRAVVTDAVDLGTPGDAFLAARGLRRVLTLTYVRLPLRGLDTGALSAVADAPHPGYRLTSWTGTVPGDLAATFAASRRAMDDMPMDDAEPDRRPWDTDRVRAVAAAVAARGDVLLTVAALTEPGGVVAGFTELVVPGAGTGDGLHYGTGVLPEHRGQGLARWMKAASIRLARARFPDLSGLVADTADSNAAMRRINRALGYAPTHRSVLYQLDLP